MPMIKPASKLMLYENVWQQLLTMIKGGTWKPGEKIPGEIALAKEFQVSRNCIRESLRALVLADVLEVKSGNGTFVTANALQQIANHELIEHIHKSATISELIEVRIFLESQIIDMVIERATNEELDQVAEVVNQEINLDWKHRDEMLKIGEFFHEALARICGNSLMIKLFDSIKTEVDDQRDEYKNISKDRWKEFTTEHKEILDAIYKRDSSLAKQLLVKHILDKVPLSK
ncbi:MAG: FadR/GntR family transcriptional regulator [Cloacibacillus evryensis]